MNDTSPSARVEHLVDGSGPVGCLLIHGLTGTPAEMAPVADALAGAYPVWNVRVAGHATRVADLAETSWLDWYASVDPGVRALTAVTPRIVVVGLSMGALLAMHLAVERPDTVVGVALLSPAIAIRRGMVRRLGRTLHAIAALDARSAALRRRLARILFPKDGSDIADTAVRARHPGYRQIPFRALLNLVLLQRIVGREVARVTQPALVVHAVHDHTCPVQAARDLYARLGSREKRLLVLERSFHVVTVDCEHATVTAAVRAFVDGVAARQPASVT